MKKNAFPQFIGVIASFFVIWLANDFFFVDKCLDNGGSFQYSTGKCLLENGDVQTSDLGEYLIGIYFFVGLIVALSVSIVIRKIFKIPLQ